MHLSTVTMLLQLLDLKREQWLIKLNKSFSIHSLTIIFKLQDKDFTDRKEEEEEEEEDNIWNVQI